MLSGNCQVATASFSRLFSCRRLAEGLSDVYIHFNNDGYAYAVYNARTLADLLSEPTAPPVPSLPALA